MGVRVVEGRQTMKILLVRRSLPWLSAPPSPRPLPMQTRQQTLLLTPGTDTTAGATDPGDTTDPTDTATTTARGLLMLSPSPLPLLIPLPTLLPTPGTDTTDGADTVATIGPTDMATGDAKTLATKLNIVLSLPTNTTEDQFLQNISLILFFKYFVLFNRVPGFIFQQKNNKIVKN